MLDKSVPHYEVMMHRKAGAPWREAPLPLGYRYSLFRRGDERHWARIEASVLEFPDGIEALIYFQRDYLPYLDELMRRCLFIEDERGYKVATASAWWSYTGSRRDPWLHWIAVDPRFQGRGLGKAIISGAMKLLFQIEGDRDFYLHTQTWSHRAIGIYESFGFEVTPEKGLAGFPNDDYQKAVDLLARIRKKA